MLQDVASLPSGDTKISITKTHLAIASHDGIRRLATSELGQGSLSALPSPIFSSVTALAVSGNLLVAGLPDHSVVLASMSSGDRVKTLFRGSLPTRHIQFRPPSGKQVALSSEDGFIRLISLNDITQMHELKGHKGIPKSTVMDLKGDYLVSAGTDGALIIWDLVEQPPAELARLNQIIETNGDMYIFMNEIDRSRPCDMSWNSTEHIVAVPSKNGEIKIVEKDTWSVRYTVKEPSSKTIVSCAWNQDGTLLASLDLEGKVSLWSVHESCTTPVDSIQGNQRICSIGWLANVSGKLIMTDIAGHLAIWEGFKTKSDLFTDNLKSMFDDESKHVDDDLLSDAGPEDDDMNDFVVDDDGAGYLDDLNAPRGLKKYEERQKKEIRRAFVPDYQDYSSSEIQECFQPGSTPMKGNRRYLAFNLLGVVYSIDQSTHSTVHIEFHDRAQRPIHFSDHYNYGIAAMGDQCAVFASEASSTNPSTIYYKPYESWGGKNDWMMQLSLNENVKGLALTRNHVAVVTDQRYLRLLTLSGLQVHVQCLSGPFVSISGRGDMLIIVYHKGGSFHGEQNLGFTLLDTRTMTCIVTDVGLPLSPSSTLDWIGFSEDSLPATYDSSGVLRVFYQSWIPILDTRVALSSSKNEHYWAVGLTDNKFMMVICKGEKTPYFPKPLIDEIPLQIPLLNLENQTGILEEKIVRGKLCIQHLQSIESFDADILTKETEMDKATLQLIQIACKNERPQRAQDLCATLRLTKSIDGAIKLALHNHLPALAEKMQLIKESKLKESRKPIRPHSQIQSQVHNVVEAPSFPVFDDPILEEDVSAIRRREEELPVKKRPSARFDFSLLDQPQEPETTKELHTVNSINPFAASTETVPHSANVFQALSHIVKKKEPHDPAPVPTANKRKAQQSIVQFASKRASEQKRNEDKENEELLIESTQDE